MPSKSPAQAHLMSALAHGWNPPASSGIHIPLSVAMEFHQADRRTDRRKKKGKLEQMQDRDKIQVKERRHG